MAQEETLPKCFPLGNRMAVLLPASPPPKGLPILGYPVANVGRPSLGKTLALHLRSPAWVPLEATQSFLNLYRDGQNEPPPRASKPHNGRQKSAATTTETLPSQVQAGGWQTVQNRKTRKGTGREQGQRGRGGGGRGRGKQPQSQSAPAARTHQTRPRHRQKEDGQVSEPHKEQKHVGPEAKERQEKQQGNSPPPRKGQAGRSQQDYRHNDITSPQASSPNKRPHSSNSDDSSPVVQTQKMPRTQKGNNQGGLELPASELRNVTRGPIVPKSLRDGPASRKKDRPAKQSYIDAFLSDWQRGNKQ